MDNHNNTHNNNHHHDNNIPLGSPSNDAMAQTIDPRDNDPEYELYHYKVFSVIATTLGGQQVCFIFIDSRGIHKKTGERIGVRKTSASSTTEVYTQKFRHPSESNNTSNKTKSIQLVGWVKKDTENDSYMQAIRDVAEAVHQEIPTACCHAWTSAVLARLAQDGVLQYPRLSDDSEQQRRDGARVDGTKTGDEGVRGDGDGDGDGNGARWGCLGQLGWWCTMM
jgi:hypothetical protein